MNSGNGRVDSLPGNELSSLCLCVCVRKENILGTKILHQLKVIIWCTINWVLFHRTVVMNKLKYIDKWIGEYGAVSLILYIICVVI